MNAIAPWTLSVLLGFAPPQGSPPFAIKVDVDLVVLHATVRDRHGLAATNLEERHFQVHEDGVRQSIRLFRHEDAPVTLGLVVDHSGSMRGKLPEVVKAAREFVESSSPEDEMFVVNFNEDVTLGLPDPLQFSNRPEDLTRAIDQTPTTGQTALYDAIAVALQQLQKGTRDKHVLIVISDGGDNASKRSLTEIMHLAVQSNAAVYTIGIFDEADEDRNPGVLRRLAQATGGESFIPGRRGDVAAICRRIATDIRQQYTIGFLSNSQAFAGKLRRIGVKAASPTHSKLSVRTRDGYFARGGQ